MGTLFWQNMQTPIILTNYKTYATATGDKALSLAKLHEEASQETTITFAVAPQAADLFRVSQGVQIPVFAQHVDAAGYGSKTGWQLAEVVKEAGASGTILNHSEHRFDTIEQLEAAHKRAKEAGLITCVCAETAEEGAAIMQRMQPDFIAVEPPELIGGNISVSTANPDLIRESVEMIGTGKVLVGAGIKNGEDVRIALELGAVGVLLASGVTKAADPKAVLLDLANRVS